MTLWTIEPRDPLLLRDGRPFGPSPGARAESLDFPFPSTVAGAVRTRIGTAAQNPFEHDSARPLQQIAVRGPLLVEISDATTGPALRWLAPAPADAVLLKSRHPAAGDDPLADLHRLAPDPHQDESATDLAGLLPVGMVRPNKEKPLANPPRFWSWESYSAWLASPEDKTGIAPHSLGHSGPARESRVHVSIRRDQQTAQEGRLFQTCGLEFTHVAGSWETAQPLGLAVAVEGATSTESPSIPTDFPAGYGTLGGERRLVRWCRQEQAEFPRCPPEVRSAVIRTGACRVVLLTPGFFSAGYRPQSLLTIVPGVVAEVLGIAVARAQVVSGWDYALGKPKSTRRLAPAGSVFFLTLHGDDEAIAEFVDRVWMQCVSDGIQGEDIGQDNRDGFGLAAVGVWPEGKRGG